MPLIRRAHPGDAPGIGKIYVESWRSTYPGLVPDAYLLGMSEQATTERWRSQLTPPGDGTSVIVAVERSHGIIGFCSCGVQRTQIAGYGGEIYTLYLSDHAQGRGVGRRLMAALAREMIGRGHAGALVWVLRDNPARWFYERLGGRRLGEQTICLGRILLPEVSYGWRDLTELARWPVNPPAD